jgi:hypothetical protein
MVPNGGSHTATPAVPATRLANRSGTTATRSVPATTNGSGSQPSVVTWMWRGTPSAAIAISA